ncbi:hypothetical protein [Cecembia rubra]|uniref:Uncharacterized protein n=1 Tax=Cecembia rubra TaxID=1485585 RepID=A0A2P8E6C3_9BACT|nr:hypothetical protein [Cecembia rubra]PSL04967.1 hypothetical protein CLV48_104141 [Cecembia rubra]
MKNLRILSNKELVQINGGSEFSIWLVNTVGSYLGSFSKQGLGSEPWKAMEERYGTNYMLWP